MKVLIVGFGSIARKHIDAIRKINSYSEIYALRSNKNANNVDNVINIYTLEEVPLDVTFIIISNIPSEHYKGIKQSIKFRRPLFIEKPPLIDLDNADDLIKLIKKNNILTYVGFNLRFNPVIKWLKKNLPLSKVIEVQAYCGSYLPDWRQGRDYRCTYSAKKAFGGGVHLDLIHELDYIRWIFGEPNSTKTFKGKKSNLEIDSFDIANYNLEYKNYYVTILLNYYRKDPKRSIEIVMKEQTWFVDLLKASVTKDNNETIFHCEDYKHSDMYLAQMQYFINNISSNSHLMNSFEESIKTLRICLS